MAKQSKKSVRAHQRQKEAAFKLCVTGGAFVLAPLFIGKSPLANMLSNLMPLGLLMLAAGGFMFWLVRSKAKGVPSLTVATASKVEPALDETSAGRAASRTAAYEPAQVAIDPPLPASRQPDRPTTWSADVLTMIEWRRFEAVVEALFRQAGFETKSQSHGADDGVDIWLYSRNQPGKPVSIVQCKHWNSKVGVDKLRELRGVMASFTVMRGQFAAISGFTDEAIAFSRANSINLLDLPDLLELIKKRTSEQQAALLDVALEGEYWKPTCVNCGDKMVSRLPRDGGQAFWGCVSYPKCKTTMQMRSA